MLESSRVDSQKDQDKKSKRKLSIKASGVNLV